MIDRLIDLPGAQIPQGADCWFQCRYSPSS